jgi:hypothetical protein
MRNKFLVLALVVLISISGVYAACSSKQVILKLSSDSNAHAELWNGDDYSVEICHPDIKPAYSSKKGEQHECKGNNLVLRLSSKTNAHSEVKTAGNYDVDVCYGNLLCKEREKCSDDEYCIVTLSSKTNAHLAKCNSPHAYPLRICCKSEVTTVPTVPELIYANWTRGGVKIENAQIGWKVNLSVRGLNLNDGERIRFEVKDHDRTVLDRDNPIRTGANSLYATISGGKAKASMTITQADYDAGSGDRKFYFVASINSNPGISIQSEILYVSEVELCMCSDGTLCEQCSSTPGQYCNGARELETDFNLCPECQNDDDCPSEKPSCVAGECIVTGVDIVSCEDYTDYDDCINDPHDVLSINTENIEEEYWDGFCDSDEFTNPNPPEGYDACIYKGIECGCLWDEDAGCYTKDQPYDTWECVGGALICSPCILDMTVQKECYEKPNPDVKIVDMIYSYNPLDDILCQNSCPDDKIDLEQKCISRVELNFFSTANLIVAIIIVMVFYLIVVKRRKVKKQAGKVK